MHYLKNSADTYLQHTLPSMLITDPRKFRRSVYSKADNLEALIDGSGGAISPENAHPYITRFFSFLFFFWGGEQFSGDQNVSLPEFPHSDYTVMFSGIINPIGIENKRNKLELSSSPGYEEIYTKVCKSHRCFFFFLPNTLRFSSANETRDLPRLQVRFGR